MEENVVMYEKVILSLKEALSAAEEIAGAGGDRWTEEIKEIIDGVQRSAKAAEYEERFKALFEKHIPAGASAYFSFSDGGVVPSEIMIEKGYICKRYPFSEETAEKSITEAAEKWRFDDMLAAI